MPARACPLTPMIQDMTMTLTEAGLYRLMTWLSPSSPLGAFSCSHGLEYAVEAQLVRDAPSLTRWLGATIARGAGSVDAALLAAAWRAATAGDATACERVTALAAAWRGTAETALESAGQGEAFVAVTLSVWTEPILANLAAKLGRKIPLSVAVGIAAAGHGIALEPTIFAFLQSFAANLVSAGVRLIPLGQTDGQRAIAALEPEISRATAAALAADLDDIGTATPLIDWCSMKHETQYTRLYRS